MDEANRNGALVAEIAAQTQDANPSDRVKSGRKRRPREVLARAVVHQQDFHEIGLR